MIFCISVYRFICIKKIKTNLNLTVHILFSATPTQELITRVRDLYIRVQDVRFLIPILNNLSREEILVTLPKLIKLNPTVVKEVFNQLMSTHPETGEFLSPITPAELLLALHKIDFNQCELKVIIKGVFLHFL